MSGPTQYWWNDTSIEYLCDDRSPEDQRWKELELVSAGTRMKSASAPYCNATATYRGGSFVSINGALSPNGSTWGCSVDGKQWIWYSAEGNGESWKTQVLCAWDYMSSNDDIRTWLATDPSGETAIALGSWIGLPSDNTEEGKTSTMDFFPTVSQPAPFDLDATPTSSTSTSSSSSGKETEVRAQMETGNSTSTGTTGSRQETGKSAEETAKAGATKSAASSAGTTLASTLTTGSTNSDSSGSSSSTANSSTLMYVIAAVGTFVVVGGLLAFVLCMKKRKKHDDDSEDENLLSSSESDSDSEQHGRHSKKNKKRR